MYRPHLAVEPRTSESCILLRASTISPEGAHSRYLEGMINELGRFCKYASDFGLDWARQVISRELNNANSSLYAATTIPQKNHIIQFIKRIDSNSGLFPSNVIITDCFFWASMQGRYNKHVVRDPHVDEDMDQFEQNIDWASEMNDTPFSDYYAGKMPLGSSSWAHKDIVYIPVNNNGAHWLTAKVDIRSRHITLYDSAIKMTPKSWFQIKNARPLAVLFRIC
ncbi:hypothetical protein FNV43_RR27165 [Rhamnella rubrinervis]|uniref:Ubiquitin-like protease family profile domain-containing protein n=1 Tax=Rhamnella rubrinervis TaxID=2594499 RepID=A0A8K0DK32_9ROSA|nr:hypothetical protein FNV43_RR27165 [Rhamnella rubrinervis]